MNSSHLVLSAPALLAIVATLVVSDSTLGAPIEVARYIFTNGSPASTDADPNTTAGDWVAANLGTSPNPPGADVSNSGFSTGASPSFNGAAFVRGVALPLATTTQSNITPGVDPSYHAFTLTVGGLLPGEALNLTNIAYDRRADTGTRGWVEVYSDLTGYTVADRLVQSFSFSTSFVNQSFGLTSFAPLSGLVNGDSVDFRLYFSSTNTTNLANVQRVDNLVLLGEIVAAPVPEPGTGALVSLVGLVGMLVQRSIGGRIAA